MKKFLKFLAPAVGAIIVLVLAPVMAGAATSTAQPTPTQTGIVRVQDQVFVVPADLAAKINSQDWRGLTEAELASAGIHPGMAAPNGSHPKLSVTSGVTPYSAFGCHANVCIYVYGTGLKVNDWDASASNQIQMCTFASYWVAGVLYATTNNACGNTDFWAYWTPDRYFINGTQLCNTFVHFAGRPCETVTG
jgi:hypothetical protein